MNTARALFTFVAIFASTQALADTVNIKTDATFKSPSRQANSTISYGFQGTKDIIFTVAGKTCTLNGSARGSVPMGCNYDLTVAPDGSISGVLAAGNAVCTQTADIARSCK